MSQVVFVDAEQVVRLWGNAQTTGLVGKTKPIQAGFFLTEPRSPSTTHGILSRVGGGDDTGGLPIDEARISASFYGATKESASNAATAYANALRALDGTKVVVNVHGSNVTMLVGDGITGPLWSPDNKLPRYLVDATILLTPGP